MISNLSFKTFTLLAFFVTGIIFSAPGLARAEGRCYCEQVATPPADQMVVGQPAPQAKDPTCQPDNNGQCVETPGFTCALKATPEDCATAVTAWTQAQVSGNSAGENKPQGSSFFYNVVPECLRKDTLDKNCRNVDKFVELLINVANYAFTIIGALALAVFVYGGVMLIISSGNSEKVSSAFSILTSAVIGLFVAFAGYMLIQFIGSSLGINELYQLK